MSYKILIMKNLSDIPKKNNFKTPEGYFDNLNKEIMSKVEKETNSTPRSTFSIFKPYIYMAASMIVLVSLLKFTLNTFVDKDPVINPNIEAKSDISLEESIFSLYEDDIAFYEYLEEDYETYASNDIADEDIEEYLSSYYLEYELLYE